MKLWFESRKERYVGHQPEIVGLLFRELQIATFGFHQLKVYIPHKHPKCDTRSDKLIL